jgi:hypothetical protein
MDLILFLSSKFSRFNKRRREINSECLFFLLSKDASGFSSFIPLHHFFLFFFSSPFPRIGKHAVIVPSHTVRKGAEGHTDLNPRNPLTHAFPVFGHQPISHPYFVFSHS